MRTLLLFLVALVCRLPAQSSRPGILLINVNGVGYGVLSAACTEEGFAYRLFCVGPA
ncbi:MAG: hypothetical protein AAFZ52_18500 [Bacteroidota bacterium]